MFRTWSPPHDPDKPPFPYMPGFTAQIHRHSPPPPFGYPHYGPRPRPSQYLYEVPQSELVVDPPPPPRDAAALSSRDRTADGPHAHRREQPPRRPGPRVFIHAPAPRGRRAAAAAGGRRQDLRRHVLRPRRAARRCAPRQWSARPTGTTAARPPPTSTSGATGQAGPGPGSLAPAYYGSWTLDLPITSRGEARTRPVRLVLVERLDGPSIEDSFMYSGPRYMGGDPSHYPLEYRLEVLARAMDGFVRQQHSGLDQWDFTAHNVILAPRAPPPDEHAVEGGAGTYLPRVVLVDYNMAVVYSRTEGGRIPLMDLPRPCNPMAYFWRVRMDGFMGWVPDEWQYNTWLMQEWLLSRFGTEEKRRLYAPVEQELVMDHRTPVTSGEVRIIDYEPPPPLAMGPELGFRLAPKNPVLFPKPAEQEEK